jgi:hypothetical protein
MEAHMEYQTGIVSSAGQFFAASGPQREDTASIRVYFQHVGATKFTDTGIWDKRSGGELDSEETTYYPGGMADRISLGGRVTPGNNTLSRLFRGERDQDNLGKFFAGVGRSAIRIVEQPMDIDGNAYGNPITWTGILKRVTPPPRDSEGTAAAMIEIEVTTTGRPTA